MFAVPGPLINVVKEAAIFIYLSLFVTESEDIYLQSKKNKFFSGFFETEVAL
jgi:hypothetical protein